jgi:preprotein translocase subunit YajC
LLDDRKLTKHARRIGTGRETRAIVVVVGASRTLVARPARLSHEDVSLVSNYSFQENAPGTAPPSDAGAQPGGGGAGGPMAGLGSLLFPILLMVFFLWMTRSQSKKQKELETGLKPGDRVVTRAGMVGKLTKVTATTVELEIAPGVQATFLKSSIESLFTADPKPGDAKSGDAKGTESKAAEGKSAEGKLAKDKLAKDKG